MGARQRHVLLVGGRPSIDGDKCCRGASLTADFDFMCLYGIIFGGGAVCSPARRPPIACFTDSPLDPKGQVGQALALGRSPATRCHFYHKISHYCIYLARSRLPACGFSMAARLADLPISHPRSFTRGHHCRKELQP